MKQVATNQKLSLTYNRKDNDTILNQSVFINSLLSTPVSTGIADITEQSGIHYRHKEDNSFIDFSEQWFVPHELSTQGPKIAVADVNGDGIEDFFVCGAKGQGGTLFLQQPNASFKSSADSAVFLQDRNCEDVDAVFFDANGDGYPDLHVASGGNEYKGDANELKDRLYMNDGKGHFTIVTNEIAPGLDHIGLVTDAVLVDIDKDGWPDLIVTGEWMPPTLFKK